MTTVRGATPEQQDEIAQAAMAVGGYFELVERVRRLPVSQGKPTYWIDPRTRKARLVGVA